MQDFSIKDECEKCGKKEDLDGVIQPWLNEDGSLYLEQATLCAPCREAYHKFVAEHKDELV